MSMASRVFPSRMGGIPGAGLSPEMAIRHDLSGLTAISARRDIDKCRYMGEPGDLIDDYQ